MAANAIRFCALGALYSGDDPRYLTDCLESLKNQTVSVPLFMVIDGPIPDALEQVLCSYADLRIRYLRLEKNGGLGRALQAGLEVIKEEYDYVLRFDADDINLPDRFKITVQYICENSPDLVSGHMREIDENGESFSERRVPTTERGINRTFPYRNPINHPASSFKIDAALAVGGFQHMPYFEDYYLWLRMRAAGCQINNIDEYLVKFRATEAMLRRRYGLSYVKHETRFFYRRGIQNLTNPFHNVLAYVLRVSVKLVGFRIYKEAFYYIRKRF